MSKTHLGPAQVAIWDTHCAPVVVFHDDKSCVIKVEYASDDATHEVSASVSCILQG